MAGAQRSMRSVPGRPDSGRAGAPSSSWAGLAGLAPPRARAASLREVFSSVSAQSCGQDGKPCQSRCPICRAVVEVWVALCSMS